MSMQIFSHPDRRNEAVIVQNGIVCHHIMASGQDGHFFYQIGTVYTQHIERYQQEGWVDNSTPQIQQHVMNWIEQMENEAKRLRTHISRYEIPFKKG